MPTIEKMDKYPNIVNLSVTQSAADTKTYEDWAIGLNLFDKVALLIHRMEVAISGTAINLLQAANDDVIFALSSSNQVDIDPAESAIIDYVSLKNHFASGVGQEVVQMPLVKDYTGMPGNGIIVAPKPLYAGVDSNNLGTAVTAQFRLYFTVIPISGADYIELIQSRQFIS